MSFFEATMYCQYATRHQLSKEANASETSVPIYGPTGRHIPKIVIIFLASYKEIEHINY
jgi:hypothetical protein